MLNHNVLDFNLAVWRFWVELMKPISHQTWDNGTNRVVKDGSPYYKARLFSAKEESLKKDVAVYFYPPHAGRHPNVTNALISAIQNAGYDVIVFELLPARWGIKSINLENLIEIGLEAYNYDNRDRIVGGVCQGMWQSVITTVVAEKKPIAQFGVAGPIDFWAGDGYIKKACQNIPPGLIRGIVALNGGIQPGWLQWLNFFSMNPSAILVDEPAKLFEHVLDENKKGIAGWHKTHSWHRDHRNLWGDSFVDIVEKLFVGNQLVRKELEICGQAVDLKRISWPFFIYAGDRDDITPPEQSFALEKYIGSNYVRKCLLENCGHTAAFNKKHALSRIVSDMETVFDLGVSSKKLRGSRWIPSKVALVEERTMQKEFLAA